MGYIFELLSNTLPGKVLWDNIETFGTAAWPVAFWIFAIQFTGRRNKFQRPLLIVLIGICIAVLGLSFTDPLHHLIRPDARIILGQPFGELTYSFTFPIMAAFAIMTAAMIYSTGLIVIHVLNAPPLYRLQAGIVAVGAIVPLVGMGITMSGVVVAFHRDTSPFTFAISSMIIGLGLSRFHFLDLVPISRDRVMDAMKDAVFVFDAKDRIIDLNRAALDLMEKKPSELLGKSAEEVFVDYREKMLKYRAAGDVTDEFSEEDGKGRRHFDLRMIPLNDIRGNLQGRAAIVREITAQREAEAELRQARDELEIKVAERTEELSRAVKDLERSQSTFRAFINTLPEPAILIDGEHKVLAANREMLARLNVSEKELAGQDVFNYLEPDLASTRREWIDEAIRSGRTIQFEDSRFDRHYLNYVCPAFDNEGRVSSIAIFALDISDRKRLEEQLRHSAKLEAMGQLASGVAHDFNNMLMGIMGYAELLGIKVQDDEKLRRLSREIVSLSSRAAGLTRQLLAFSRKGEKETIEVDLHFLAKQVNQLLERTIDRRIEIKLDLASPVSTVMGDPALLENAILNLAVNARDAMPDGGSLRISTRTVELDLLSESVTRLDIVPGPYIAVAVCDTGVGMDEAVRKNIFEPFFTTKSPGKGTGLGLAAVWGTVRDHGGAVEVESQPGRGSTFTILLPLSSPETKREEQAETGLPAGSGTILLVEDEEALREIAEQGLIQCGFTVLTAEDGLRAVEVFNERHADIDLVVLDMIMPRMNGRDAFLKIRAVDPAIRVLISSGYMPENDADVLIKEGVSGFVNKPYRIVELARKVAETLKGNGSQRPG